MPDRRRPGIIGFRHLRTRLLVFVAGLLVAVQALAFVAVYGATDRNARNQIDGELASSARVGAQLVGDRIQGLMQAERLVSGDFAFKRAYGLRHERTWSRPSTT